MLVAVAAACLSAPVTANGAYSLAGVYWGRVAESRVDLQPPDCAALWNPQERELARLFETDRQQRRRVHRCDPILTRVARARAADMARRRYFAHVNPDGDGPNIQVTRAGYQLPPFYEHKRKANNVEVILAGDETPADAWRGWLRSRHHREQVLGLDRFFADQGDYGVGYVYAPGTRYEHYWVLITARH